MDSLLECDITGEDLLQPPWGDLGRDATLGLVSGICKLVLQYANSFHVQGLQRFHDIVMRREPGRGLITYSNHTSTLDDPGLESAMLPWSYFWTEHQHRGMRWTMCAKDICFRSELLRQFFQSGKTLPIDRGAGVEQPSMAAAARRIAAGDWLHLFPEGKVSADGHVAPFKWGIGKVMCDARLAAGGRDPLVLPFMHSGMGHVMPYLASLPRVGHTVEVVVGEPVDLGHITCRCGKAGEDQQQVWQDIAAAMRAALLDLQPHLPPNPNQLQERPELAEHIKKNAEKVLDARGFRGSEGDDLPDTYAVLAANSSNRFVSRVAKKELVPCWREGVLLRQEELDAAGQVLSLELWAVRRWGADALLGQAELALDELPVLLPGQPPLAKTLTLLQPSKASGARARPGQAAPEGGSMRVELSAVRPPPPPAAPLTGGPTPSPMPAAALSTCASLLARHCPVLHTLLGELYEAPPVQLIKLTIHKADGLHNLHMEPAAAAAGGSPTGRLAAALRAPSSGSSQRQLTGSSSSSSSKGGSIGSAGAGGPGGAGAAGSGTSDAAAAAAAAAQQFKEKGTALLNKTSDWFKKQKASRFGAGAAAVLATVSASSAAAAAAHGRGTSPPPFSGTSPGTPAAVEMSPRPSTESLELTPLSPTSEARQAAAAAVAAAAAAADAAPAGETEPGLPEQPLTSLAAAEQEAEGEAGQQLPLQHAPASAAAVDTFNMPPGHERVGSVDASVVLAGLEELGFHATDAPGGSFFYIKAGLQGQGEAAACSKMAALTGAAGAAGAGGAAVWEEAFLLAAPRPVEAGAKLELELFAAPDKKQRGRCVCHVEESLSKLLDPAAAAPSSSGDVLRSEMVLVGHFSKHLYCRIWVTLEVVDEGPRAAARQLPRVLAAPESQQPPGSRAGTAGNGSAASSGGMHLATAVQPGSSVPPMAPPPPRTPNASRSPKGTAAGPSAELGTPSTTATPPAPTPTSSTCTAAAQQLPLSAAPVAAAVAAAVATGLTSPSQQPTDAAVPAARSPAAASPAPALDTSIPGSDTAGQQRQQQRQQGLPAAVGAAAEPVQPAPPANALAALGPPFSDAATLGALELMVDSFELDKPADCFFVLQFGPYWAVSSTQHSSGCPLWRWQLQLPITDPAAVLSLALYKRQDQKEGKKVVSMRAVFSDALLLIGKLRVRLSTMAPNQPISITLPMSGERTNLKAGPTAAAKARLHICLRVPRVLTSWLRAYGQPPVWPPLFLLAAASGEAFTVDAASAAAQRVALKWLEDQAPGLPSKVARRVLDDGRAEFTLSRTRQNWRRLTMLHASLAPAAAAYAYICSWDSPMHSGAVVSGIVLFGLYPSRVLAVAAVAAAVGLWRLRERRRLEGALALPPAMEGDDAAPNEEGGASAGSVAPPTDAYTALKQNYDGVMAFAGVVQNVLDGWACAGERAQALVSWADPMASSVLVGVLLLAAAGLWLLGLRVLVTIGLLWAVRPPALRDPLPAPPDNFMARLPTRSDTLM